MAIVESIDVQFEKIPAESLPEFKAYREWLQLFFQISYQKQQKEMILTETGSTINWLTCTNNESSPYSFEAGVNLRDRSHGIRILRLILSLNIGGVESHHRKIIIKQIVNKVEKIVKSKPTIKVLPLAVNIVFCKTSYVHEKELLESICGENSTAKEWIEKVLNSEKVVTEKDCAVCFDFVDTGIRLRCNHVFHTNCIKEWGLRRHSCPLCPREIPS